MTLVSGLKSRNTGVLGRAFGGNAIGDRGTDHVKIADLLLILKNACLDFRYGGRFLAGSRKTRFAEAGAEDTANSSYAELGALFGDRIGERDVIVDVGCGKGRVFNWLLSRGRANRMIGIELDPEIAEGCRRRLRTYTNIRIITGNILENVPDNGTIFYLFNPFHEMVMRSFAEELKRSYQRNKREITVIYSNCLFCHVFEEDPRWIVTPLEAGLRLPAAIIRIRPESI